MRRESWHGSISRRVGGRPRSTYWSALAMSTNSWKQLPIWPRWRSRLRPSLQVPRFAARRLPRPLARPRNDSDGLPAHLLPRSRPAPTQRAIQLHRGRQLPQLRLTQPELGVEEAALCLEHLDIAGDAGAVAKLGQLECPPERLGLSFLRDDLIARAPDTGKRVARFAKRDQDTLLVLQPGLIGPGSGRASLVHQPAAGEEWERHPGERLIDLTVPVEQVADLSHLGAVIAGDGYGRQTRRLRHADPGVGCRERTLRLLHVGPALQQ